MSSLKSEILHFDGLLLSKSYKFTEVQKSYLSWHRRVIQSLKNNWLVVSVEISNLVNFHPTTVKSENFTSMGSFCRKYIRLEVKTYRELIFHEMEQWHKISLNTDLAFSKMPWGTWWTFIRPLKSLKHCTLIGCFCPKHIMFQLKNSTGIMCHDTEVWCKI